MHVLPDVQVSIVEYTETEHNKRHGIDRGVSSSTTSAVAEDDDIFLLTQSSSGAGDSAGATTSSKSEKSTTGKKAKPAASRKSMDGKEKDQMYYLVSCKDNGCGIPASHIGDMLGKVLSGSKHGVRQTRGKFGLGAKMVRGEEIEPILCTCTHWLFVTHCHSC
jgi:hypothetical protein